MTEDQQSNSQEIKISQKRKRGIWLTIWLILLLLGNINTSIGVLLNVRAVSQVKPELFSGILMWKTYAIIFIAFLNIISLIFLFLWKRWAFFTLCGGYFLIFVIMIFILPIFGLNGIGMIFALGILYLLLRPKWQLLE